MGWFHLTGSYYKLGGCAECVTRCTTDGCLGCVISRGREGRQGRVRKTQWVHGMLFYPIRVISNKDHRRQCAYMSEWIRPPIGVISPSKQLPCALAHWEGETGGALDVVVEMFGKGNQFF